MLLIVQAEVRAFFDVLLIARLSCGLWRALKPEALEAKDHWNHWTNSTIGTTVYSISIPSGTTTTLIPLLHICEDIYKISTDWVSHRSYGAIGSFVLWSLDSNAVDLANHQGVVKGYKKAVQQSSSKSQVRSCGFKAVVPKTRLKFRGAENVQNGNGKFQFGSPHPLGGTNSKKTNAKTEKIEANLCRIAVLVTLISNKIENVMYVKTVLRCRGAQHIYLENQITKGNNQKMKRNIVTFGDMLRKIACPRVPIMQVYAATNHLNEMNIIGKGTSGKVYKGTMTNNLNVAIKHLINDDGNVDTFVREITSLSHVRHPNISSFKQSQFTWCQLKVELNKEYT
ncbi:hypothetical protein JHK87_039614 [Glycine soja]|nr:hypothetical protein JHK87_039614 [Glycine soja]